MDRCFVTDIDANIDIKIDINSNTNLDAYIVANINIDALSSPTPTSTPAMLPTFSSFTLNPTSVRRWLSFHRHSDTQCARTFRRGSDLSGQ